MGLGLPSRHLSCGETGMPSERRSGETLVELPLRGVLPREPEALCVPDRKRGGAEPDLPCVFEAP